LKLVRLSDYSGNKCSIYTILEDNGVPKFQTFLEELGDSYFEKLVNVVGRLKSMGNSTGAVETFIKLDEGLDPNDMVCALYDEPEREIRLYCIRISERIMIIGGGGPKNVRAWQHDAKLTREVKYMMTISEIVRTKMRNGDIKISTDGLKLNGNLSLP
jgi:hypothetical protein